MLIHFRCARCQKKYSLDAQKEVSKMRCPGCQARLNLTALYHSRRLAKKTDPDMIVSNPLEKRLGAAGLSAVNWRIVAGTCGLVLLLVGMTIAVLAPAPLEPSASSPSREAVASVQAQRSSARIQAREAAVLNGAAPSDASGRTGRVNVPARLPENRGADMPRAPIVNAPVAVVPLAEQIKKAAKKFERPEKMIVKRRDNLAADDLRRDLSLMADIKLASPPPAALFVALSARARQVEQERLFGSNDRGDPSTVVSQSALKTLSRVRKDRKVAREDGPFYAGLPLRMGIDCQLGKEAAQCLQVLSRKMRVALSESTPKNAGDNVPDADLLRNRLLGEGGSWLVPEAIPTMTQMLMAENKPIRMLLVELLARIQDPKATEALAQRALYDLSFEVRAKALEALWDRPAEEYRSVLLSGFRYPWAPVADHAAEAVTALQDLQTIPELLNLLEAPDPSVVAGDSLETSMIREVVRVNHLANCAMCHAESRASTDPVRGRIPPPSEALPPLVAYYESDQGIFVHADVTYLRQDFSVPQMVENPGPWPLFQRYDYMVRTRPLSKAEIAAQRMQQTVRDGKLAHLAQQMQQNVAAGAPQAPTEAVLDAGRKTAEPSYPQREAVLFALRELTGKDAGSSARSWRELFGEKDVPVTARAR